ncbi:MAG TPA: type I DNA topoisomerase [Ktedonobacterales bacterium]|nr:type I DNA topoisomerase [Ktedonobacterales bacterium]
MAKNLVIVESPAKAKTIEKFLGSDFEVRASMGHIIDLPRNGLGVDTRKDFEPKYVVIEKKDHLLSELKAASKKAENVFLAPDPDREGEFIAWSLKYMLGLRKPRRAVFNEITRHAVQEAVAHPREIDENLFNAQQARRVLDRLVGYKISPLLWRRVQRGTSAGRVQSVALRLICDREAEIRAFVPEEYWTITATLSKAGQRATFEAALIGRQGSAEAQQDAEATESDVAEVAAGKAGQNGKASDARRGRIRIGSEAEANAILAELHGARYVVRQVEKKDVRRQPYLPYTTSTLQQDASARLHFKPKRTMSLAQDLYEGVALGDRGQQGLITYMRTDSTRVADEARTAVRDYIRATFSKDHVGEGRTGKAKAGVQDAHEAIRPTDVSLTPEVVKPYLGTDHFKLYQLIWRRFVASFMAPAIFDTVRASIGAGAFLFRASGSTLRFEGFYAVWPREEDGTTLPELAASEPLDLRALKPDQHFTQPPARFNEASLIKELEELGIGRPSTYVPIVSTIQDRNYVEQVERRFVPTWLGETVNELMLKHFAEIVDTHFTADMEQRLDAVEQGAKGWTAFLKDFYAELKTQLERAETEMDKVQKPVEELDEPCPTCGRPLVIRTGRFGRFISCSGFPECDFRRSLVVKTGAICPVDGGELLERKTRKSGKVFFGCANYPNCSFATWDRPLALPCPECGGLLTQGANAPTAACAKCGALVAGVAEGTPEVVGHRDPAAARPQRSARATSGATKAAAATRRTGATTARATTARKTTTTARKTTAGKTTRAAGSTTRKATGATRARATKS